MFGLLKDEALSCKAFMMSLFLASGNACHKQDVMPAIFGHEKEVPEEVTGSPVCELATIALEPNAATFGFTT